MRPLQKALVTALALAYAGAAAAAVTANTAATSSRPAAMPAINAGNGITGTFVNSAPATPTTVPATTTTTTTATPTTGPVNTTTVDSRSQATAAATAATHASGSTSAIDQLLTQQASAPSSETGTTGTGAVTTSPLIAGYAFNPSDVTSLPNAGNASPFAVASNTILAPDVTVGSQVTQLEAARADANVNRAIAQVQRDRKRIGRNGQLLYSIAPRTNVDRSAEMPDDGPPPSLTGSNSTLAR